MQGYNQTEIVGKLFVGGERYWIVNTSPLTFDSWQRDERVFLGVNVDGFGWFGEGSDAMQTYPTVHAIIVNGTWHIEVLPPEEGYIWTKKAEVADFFNALVPDPEDVEHIEWIENMVKEFELLKEID